MSRNSMFGRCTCGVPKRDGVPCIHMAVLVLAGDLPEPMLTQVSIMPYWLTTAHWRQQYPQDLLCLGSLSIKGVMGFYQPDATIRYGPEWAAPRKAGRPKGDNRVMSVVDHIENSAKKRKRQRKLFCSICNKFNHNTDDCYQNQKNARDNDHQGDAASPMKTAENYEEFNEDYDEGATGVV